MTARSIQSPFTLQDIFDKPIQKRLFSFVERPVAKILGTRQLQKHYAQVSGASGAEVFARRALDELDISYACDLSNVKNIPRTGALVVVANHPYGVVEGMILTVLMKSIRPDVKIMANHLLQQFPEYDDMIIPVDPYGHSGSARSNIKGLRESIKWVRDGGALIVFPSGTVSHFQFGAHHVVDPEWSPTIGRIIQKTKAAVQPVYFQGHNNLIFQAAGLINAKLRSLLIPRNLLNKRGKTIRFRLGKAIPASKLTRFESADALMDYVRFRTYLFSAKKRKRRVFKIKENPIIAPIPRDALLHELARLPEKNLLLTSKQFNVYYAESQEIPQLLMEIGRLREISFRACGEGTGTEVDLDDFDDYYTHLFVWDREDKEVVGAYRMCPMQETIAERGLNALYTHQFFRYEPEFFDNIKPALEMGRSFVQPKYQRLPSSLFLLWRGIGHYVAQHPKFKILMGPVSISNDYRDASRQLIVRFLKSEMFDRELAKHVHPENPYGIHSIGVPNPDTVIPMVHEIEEISSWISDIDPRCQSVPVMLKHYIKLGGRIAGFNLDHDFCDVLDALIMVDYSKVELRQLSKYMGKQQAEAYLACCALSADSQQQPGTVGAGR